MRNKSHAKSMKVTITALTIALFLTCFLSSQPLFADAFTRAGNGTSLISMGSDVTGLVEMASSNRMPARFIITYHPNGGEGQTVEESVEANAEYTIQNQRYTNKRFVLAGWNTSPKGLGLDYNIGQVINVTENIHLYAKWSQGI